MLNLSDDAPPKKINKKQKERERKGSSTNLDTEWKGEVHESASGTVEGEFDDEESIFGTSLLQDNIGGYFLWGGRRVTKRYVSNPRCVGGSGGWEDTWT